MVNWSKRTYTESEFTSAWLESISIAECARKLNLARYGSTYSTLKATAKELEMTSDHMLGQASTKGRKYTSSLKKPLSEILVSYSTYNGTSLKKRLISEGILEYKCSVVECSLTSWMGSEITLHLDHINGVNTDHRIDNLRLLCPNCHSQTSTYTGRNKSSVKRIYQ